MHSAQVADLGTEIIDKHINKGLRRISGLIDSVQLRCDLGVLPAEMHCGPPQCHVLSVALEEKSVAG